MSSLSAQRDDLVREHLEFARKIARKLAEGLPSSVDFADVESAARLGLIEAASRYDPTSKASFTTFAWYRIRGAVLDALAKMSTLPWPARKIVHRRSLEDEWTETVLRGGASARHPADLARMFSRAVQGLASVHFVFSMNDHEDGATDRDHPVETRTPHDDAETNELLERLREARERLDDRERRVVTMIYDEGLTITAVAEREGTHKSTISRLHARALDHLRGHLVGGSASSSAGAC